MGAGTRVCLENPGRGGSLGRGVDWKVQSEHTPSSQLLPLPALFLPHREIFSFLHTQCSLSCIRPFTRLSLHLEYLFQNSTHPSRTPAEVTSSRKPASLELPLLLLLHLLRCAGGVFLSAFRH